MPIFANCKKIFDRRFFQNKKSVCCKYLKLFFKKMQM
jgi:hypothetical protein